MPKNKSNIVDINSNKMTKDKKPGELNFKPHPNVIIGVPVDESKTKSGIILPNQDKTPTPVVEIYAVGENNKDFVKEGDYVYIDQSYMRFAMIDMVKCVFLMPDAIIGWVVEDE